MRIAVVDNTPDVAISLIALLIDHGYEASAINPASWEQVPWDRYDAAVVDLNLGKIDGVAVLEWLREYHPNIRRIAMSGLIERLDAARGVTHARLEKPFWSADLERVLTGR